jgi:hypothetical protein
MSGGELYLAEGEGRKLVEEAGGVGEAVAAGDDSGGRRAASFSRADLDLDRGFAVRRSAMDYAIGRQAGGGSDGRRRGGNLKYASLMGRLQMLSVGCRWSLLVGDR